MSLRSHRLAAPEALLPQFERQLDRWQELDGTARIWARDASLWTGGDEDCWLGWLESPSVRATSCEELQSSVEGLRSGALSEVERLVLLGMGGSALGADLLVKSLGSGSLDRLDLVLLDTLAPAEVLPVLEAAEEGKTAVVSASKSGSTLETRVLTELFLERVPPCRFVAVTDPDSELDQLARDLGFAATFAGDPEIGGRFSVLSPFGLVPAALAGCDFEPLLVSARRMAGACRVAGRVANPGVELGALLAASVLEGRNKLALLVPPDLASFAAWIEQLVAESTGKDGQGMLPIVGELVAEPGWRSDISLGPDRLWVELSGLGEDAQRLRSAGQPVATLPRPGPAEIGGELFRWMFGTAVAAALLGVHPFDQPDVESSKRMTRAIVASEEGAGHRQPAASDGSIEWFAEGSGGAGAEQLVTELLCDLSSGDFVALLAFLPRTTKIEGALHSLRTVILELSGLAVSVGFGPRYLHSTGQLFKGGSTGGRFLVFSTSGDPNGATGPRAAIGCRLSDLHQAQAVGDCQALAERGRPVLRAHFADDPAAGLAEIEKLVHRALS